MLLRYYLKRNVVIHISQIGAAGCGRGWALRLRGTRGRTWCTFAAAHRATVAPISATIAAAPIAAPIAAAPGEIGRTLHTLKGLAATLGATALAAAAALNQRALLITPYADQLPTPLPPHAHAVSYAPFDALLPRLAALVHHGGIGSTAEALRAGIPQLVVALAFDQFDNAARLATLGAGLAMKETASDADLQDGLQALLQSGLGLVAQFAEVMQRQVQALGRHRAILGIRGTHAPGDGWTGHG